MLRIPEEGTSLEQRTVRVRQPAGSRTSEEDAARFLRELRQLRDFAGLEQAELAARAHYPHDYIRGAEAGPALPDLPLLAAYVRGCGGTVDEWEERWRSLTNTPALALLPTRSAGCSTAATAGARIGSVSPIADVPDPSAIIAALNRVAEKITAGTSATDQSWFAPPAVTGFSMAPSMVTKSAPPAPSAATSPSPSPVVAAEAEAGPTSSLPVPALAPGTAGAPVKRQATTVAAGHPVPGGPFPWTPRTAIAALIVVAICMLVAVLAIFA